MAPYGKKSSHEDPLGDSFSYFEAMDDLRALPRDNFLSLAPDYDDSLILTMSDRNLLNLNSSFMSSQTSGYNFDQSCSFLDSESLRESHTDSNGSMRSFFDSESTFALDNSFASIFGGESFAIESFSIAKPQIPQKNVGQRRGCVRFGSVSVREYTVTLGQQDSVSCPVVLTWIYKETKWRDIDSYQNTTGHCWIPKPMKPRRLPVHERRHWIATSMHIPVSQVERMERDQSNAMIIPSTKLSCFSQRFLNGQTNLDAPPKNPRARPESPIDSNYASDTTAQIAADL